MMHGWGWGVGWGGPMGLFGLLPLILLAGGMYLLFRWRGRPYTGTGQTNSAGRNGAGAAPDRKIHARDLYRLARERGGILTVSEVVVTLGVDPKDAEEALEHIVDGRYVDMDVKSDGRVVYRFVEIAGKDKTH